MPISGTVEMTFAQLPLSRRAVRVLLLGLAVCSVPVVYAFTRPHTSLPEPIDVRGPTGVPRGLTAALQPGLAQQRVLQLIGRRVGTPDLRVQYNGLTATPRALSNPSGYLTLPSTAAPEAIARRFLADTRDLYRFSDEDLDGLRVQSQATQPDTGTTIVKLQQTIDGTPVFQSGVLVNVAKSGQVISAGDDSFPQLRVTNRRSLTAASAVAAAARSFGLAYSPAPIGTTRVLQTYGQVQPQFVDAPTFAGGGVFSGDIAVTPTIFPIGATALQAWEFVVVTPQFSGAMWQFVVDAESGTVLRRVSLTHFVDASPGGGVGVGRRATFRPDVQTLVENLNNDRSASGMIFDTHPVTISAAGGTGRATRSGTAPSNYVYMQPTYEAETPLTNGYRYSLVQSRNEEALPFAMSASPSFDQTTLPDKLGQVLRGFPDATHGSASSPFGWFYLPTDSSGAEFKDGDANHAATEAFGYVMDADAVTRNKVNPANSPGGTGLQPFSATLSSLPGPVTLADGRVMTRVLQSNYTEGNNVFVSDDRANDNDSTLGIRGYSPTRQFTAPYFLFTNSYEFGGTDVTAGTGGGASVYPASADPDVFPGAVSLFFGNNIEHDYLYSIGFTEAFWNFQQDNFGKGGAGGDAVSAQIQDGSGTDNANFGTPADGSRPTMQMYLFTDSGLRRSDGAFDWDVFAHEYYHGVSTRSSGKGAAGCLVAGVGLTGEAGGQGEGWSDTIASSLADDDNEGEYVTGNFDEGIRGLPYTNYRFSYGAINGIAQNRRDQARAGVGTTIPPFEVHYVGEIWAATLWDLREMLIMKDPNGVFFDGNRRLGNGTTYYAGNRALKSVDTAHPIDYRYSTTAGTLFDDTNGATPQMNPAHHTVRPGLLAAEIAQRGDRNGPLATAVAKGGRLADTLVLRGLQLGLCQPAMTDSRDSILAADKELTGGENRAIIWRVMASHGIGNAATSTSSADTSGSAGAAPVVVEDFTVPAGVTACETSGPLPAPSFTLKNTKNNTVTVTINGGMAVAGANQYLISRGRSANGPFALIASVPAATTSYDDNDNGSGLQLNTVYYYQVRAARDAAADCVSQFDPAATQNITLSVGSPPAPNPVFAGVATVEDPKMCNLLSLSWLPATSTNPTAKLVYDVYRVSSVTAGNGLIPPSFTPSSTNRIQQGLTATSFVDTGLTRNQVYYYIVQARDADNGRIDTANTGNTAVRFNAPSSPSVGTPAFAAETYEAMSADTRFTPPLLDETSPQINLLAWQRVSNVDLGGGVTSSVMYAPDVDPTNGGVTDPVLGITVNGAPSDNSTTIGPLTLTADSVMEYDSKIQSENSFDGGVVELSLAPVFTSTPYPDNTTSFDLGPYMVTGGYNGALTGPSAAGPGYGSLLMGRLAYTGSRGLKHTRIPLKDFAPGGAHNAQGLQVYIRFRMTTDVLSNVGPTSGWYVDNLVINNQAACPVDKAPLAVLTATPTMGYAPLQVTLDGSGSSDPDSGDRVVQYVFDFGDGTGSTQTTPSASVSYKKGTYTAKLTVKDIAGASSNVATQTITVLNNPPTAAITANPTTQGKGKAVAFDASGSGDLDGDPLTYTFDFGDGSATVTQSGTGTSHTYVKSGSYTVSVQANDGTDSSNKATTTVSITNTAPTAALAATPVRGTVPFSVTFDASGSSDPDTGDQVLFYHFDFGDGSSVDASQPMVSHSYTTAGSYNATVKVYDNENAPSANVGMAMITADPGNVAPTARLSVTPASGTAPLTVTLDATASSDPDAGDSVASYSFSFGDGSASVTQSTPTVEHTYTSAGSYTPSVTVQDTHGASSTAATSKVTVNAPTPGNRAPTAVLSADPTQGTLPLSVRLDGSGSSDPDSGDRVASYTFDFGDGTPKVTSALASVQHVYATSGSFTASLVVTDGQGATSNTASVTITVREVAAPTPGRLGGGAFGLGVLVPLLAAALRRRRRPG